MAEVLAIGNMLLSEAHKGRTDLVEAVIKMRDLPHTKWLDRRMDMAPAAVAKCLVSMACTMSIRLLGHLVMGQLPRAMITEEAIDEELQGLMVDSQPTIFANYVVNNRGHGPSPTEWPNFITGLHRYMEDDSYSVIIDGVFNPLDAVDGTNKYLSTKKSIEENLPMCQGCIAILGQFIAALEKRIGNTPNPDQRMARPLSEVGYSRHPLGRLRAHAQQSSFNFIMGLCMAVLEQEEPYTGFQLSQHVAMWIYEPKGAALGEVFITALMRAYTVHAGGFTHAAAGISGNNDNNGAHIKRTSEETVKRAIDATKSVALMHIDSPKFRSEMTTSYHAGVRYLKTLITPDLIYYDITAELAEEKKKRDAMWKEIERSAPEIERLARTEMGLIDKAKAAFH
ncbi:hypothetical protein ACLOAV_005058 [Pseudogymnoascus australis]